jgi:hypothetical protein
MQEYIAPTPLQELLDACKRALRVEEANLYDLTDENAPPHTPLDELYEAWKDNPKVAACIDNIRVYRKAIARAEGHIQERRELGLGA